MLVTNTLQIECVTCMLCASNNIHIHTCENWLSCVSIQCYTVHCTAAGL